MGQAFYRKYRSKSFDEVIGQQHITATLANAIKSGRISHAYLFTGPKGVGKTSVARILAHAVNDLPYDDDSMHLDIIEIDAASNRRIDEIRDLRERVHTAPTSARYKVYIIDEVHMLTREAFNALLKTLEEPPEHCIFILATTEAHKLPETIISRTQRFNFKLVGGEGAANHIKTIASREKIAIEPGAIDLIVEHGDGSFRDSIGILDQLSSHENKITVEMVRQFLGLPPDEAIASLTDAITNSDAAKALQVLTDLKEQGTSAPKVAERLGRRLRDNLLEGGGRAWIPTLLRQLLLVPSSPSPHDQLEISILEAATSLSGEKNMPRHTENRIMGAKSASAPTAVKKIESKKKAKQTKPQAQTFDLSMWQLVVDTVKSQATSVYTALRLAEPRIDGDTLTLTFQFPLHQKKLSQANNMDVLGRVIEEASGKKMAIKCVVDKNVVPIAVPENIGLPYTEIYEKTDDIPIKTISNIFGSAEVLES